MLSEEPFSKVQKVNHHADSSTSGGPSNTSGLLNSDTSKNEQISKSYAPSYTQVLHNSITTEKNLDVEQKENAYFQELSSVEV